MTHIPNQNHLSRACARASSSTRPSSPLCASAFFSRLLCTDKVRNTFFPGPWEPHKKIPPPRLSTLCVGGAELPEQPTGTGVNWSAMQAASIARVRIATIAARGVAYAPRTCRQVTTVVGVGSWRAAPDARGKGFGTANRPLRIGSTIAGAENFRWMSGRKEVRVRACAPPPFLTCLWSPQEGGWMERCLRNGGPSSCLCMPAESRIAAPI